MKTNQEPEYPLRARGIKVVDGQNHRGGNGGPFEPGCCLIVADNPDSAYDHLITVFPSDLSSMLIAFCLLYLTYSPWPVAGAIWTRSTKIHSDTDGLREFAGSEDGCKSGSPPSACTFSVTDAPLSRLFLEAVSAELEGIFHNHGECRFAVRALASRGV